MAVFRLVGIAVALILSRSSYFSQMTRCSVQCVASTSSIEGCVVGRLSFISTSDALPWTTVHTVI